jgi:hypothetical protein
MPEQGAFITDVSSTTSSVNASANEGAPWVRTMARQSVPGTFILMPAYSAYWAKPRVRMSAVLHILALIEGCLLARIEPALDVCDHVFKKHAIQIIGNIGDVGAS